jgi:hypothetical protein
MDLPIFQQLILSAASGAASHRQVNHGHLRKIIPPHEPSGLNLTAKFHRSCHALDGGVLMKANWFASLLLAVMFGSLPALGHHSFSAEYDETKPVKVSGVVTRVEWQNPHIWFYVVCCVRNTMRFGRSIRQPLRIMLPPFVN